MKKDFEINLGILNYKFSEKPLLFGGKAMEYYGLRKAGSDIDFVINNEDHINLKNMYPNNMKNLYGDIGICEFGFEMWNQICTFDYNYLKENALEEKEYIIISLEKLLFLKALAMKIPKYHKDLELIVELVLKKAYGKIIACNEAVWRNGCIIR
ncbi:MAG: hypothetical protein LBI42_02725 [Chitinispirillales bacterium]|jgi:hypothetical protein|nr:hypothetical protein [Chitinispirillales bacterium]